MLTTTDDDKYDYHRKTSLQSKFKHCDAKNALHYSFPLSYYHNQLLIVMKQRCDPSKVDDLGITTTKKNYVIQSLYHATIIIHHL